MSRKNKKPFPGRNQHDYFAWLRKQFPDRAITQADVDAGRECLAKLQAAFAELSKGTTFEEPTPERDA